eukprot:PhM_4_TR3463/c1_g1_i1/m.25542
MCRRCVPRGAVQEVTISDLGALPAVVEAALDHAVACELAHVVGAELPNLRRDRVLLDEGLLRLVELQWVVGAKGDVETAREEVREWVLEEVEEETVVAERRHGDAHLGEVVDVLKSGAVPQIDTVVNLIARQETCHQVVCGTTFTAVGSEFERRQATRRAEFVQRANVHAHIIHPVHVRRLFVDFVFMRGKRRAHGVDQRLVVDTVEATDVHQEVVQLGVLRREDANLPQRLENVLQQITKRKVCCDVPRQQTRLHKLVQSRDLNEPLVVWRRGAICVKPLREFVPFSKISAIDRNTVLCKGELVAAELLKRHLRQLREVPAAHVVACLEEDLA